MKPKIILLYMECVKKTHNFVYCARVLRTFRAHRWKLQYFSKSLSFGFVIWREYIIRNNKLRGSALSAVNFLTATFSTFYF
uniref:Uncharacterized protein n=1 Tax=Anguilla anguilla TaxID=7936 RepID=A0A0E9PSL3_ANGAN